MSSCHCGSQYESGVVKVSDYWSDIQPTWCGGCGNFGIWAALKRALVELKLSPQDVLLCFDVGCNGNMSDKIRGYRIHSLHGRVLPLAAAAKIANPRLKVIAMAGDGATYSEGIGHFLNTLRNNFPITFFVHDNGNYGLTTGQASATTPQGAKRTANPDGPTAFTINPVEIALNINASFVGRGFSGDIKQLVEIMKEAIMYQDKGLAFVDILQACPTYNKETSHTWYLDRVRDVKQLHHDYDPGNLIWAKELAKDISTNIATGVLYRNDYSRSMHLTPTGDLDEHSLLEGHQPHNPNYLERLVHRSRPESPWQNSTLVGEVDRHDISKFLDSLR